MRTFMTSTIICILLCSGCISFGPRTQSNLSFTSRNSSSCGLKLVYQPKMQAASNYLATLAFGTSEWLEYSIDGNLAARHQAHQSLNTVAYLDPGEHSLQIHNVIQGVTTLGTLQRTLVKSYEFTVYDGQIGTLRLETVNGEYVSNIRAVGFENVSYWNES